MTHPQRDGSAICRLEGTEVAAKVVRAPMPRRKRAAQFAMFDALKGLKEAIAEKERIPTPRRILSDDAIAEINAQLTNLKSGNVATVVYYCDYAQEYHQITGPVRKVDGYWKVLQIGDLSIDFCEIAEIEKVASNI